MLSHAEPITLELATPAQRGLLGNLLELYIHDLSAIFSQVELGPDGRFGYPELPSYLSGASDRSAFLVRCGARVAGFILVRRGSPASDDPNVLDIAEFFVLRRFRRQGVGNAAACLLWESMPGSWTVRTSVKNPAAVAFWRAAVAAYTHGRAREAQRSIGTSLWTVFSFDSGERAA